MTALQRLHDAFGQSPWIDGLSRSDLESGILQARIKNGVRGLTSNPSIVASALATDPAYAFADLVDDGRAASDVYWDAVVHDIAAACDAFESLHRASAGEDGRVSVEVDPRLAHDAPATVAFARYLVDRIDRPNLLIKVPATQEGLEALRVLTADGISTNATLIFSVERYRAVADAYAAGLEDRVHRSEKVHGIFSVASFFVSRVDAAVDFALGDDVPSAARGHAAVAQATLAYDLFETVSVSDRLVRLRESGANPQRLLWASTATKDPAASPLKYVNGLVARGTVTTLPPALIDALIERDDLAPAFTADRRGAEDAILRLTHAGIDLGAIAIALENDGLRAFEDAFMSGLDQVAAYN